MVVLVFRVYFLPHTGLNISQLLESPKKSGDDFVQYVNLKYFQFRYSKQMRH